MYRTITSLFRKPFKYAHLKMVKCATVTNLKHKLVGIAAKPISM